MKIMSREIKFRVWNTNLKKWVHPVIDITNSFNSEHPNKFMQFTGLKDKNGTDIYEGDIIQSPQHNPDKMEVKFIEGGFCMDWGDSNLPIDINHFFDSTGVKIEVIGNIHETK